MNLIPTRALRIPLCRLNLLVPASSEWLQAAGCWGILSRPNGVILLANCWKIDAAMVPGPHQMIAITATSSQSSMLTTVVGSTLRVLKACILMVASNS